MRLGDSIRKPLVALPGTDGKGLSDEELKFIMDINLTEALLCTRAVGPHMLERRSGKVINISSFTAHAGGGDLVVYTAAKAGLVGFTRAQALEWAPYGIHVNAISPGFFPDPVTVGEERAQQTQERCEQTVPLKRAGRLREVGLLALYLASDASDYMTGQTIILDGGSGFSWWAPDARALNAARSVQLDVGGLDDLSPAFRFGFLECRQLGDCSSR